MSQNSDATPFSIDDILGNELESHGKHHHREKKYKTNDFPCEKQIVTAIKQERTHLPNKGPYFIGGRPTLCDSGPVAADGDEIDQEMAKIRHEFARNYRSYFAPHAYSAIAADRASRDRLLSINRPYPRRTPSHHRQQDIADTARDYNVTTQDAPQLPATCSVGGITVTLENSDLWQTFNKCGTEMILNRSGRRMFPYVSVRIEGMNALTRYSVKIDIRSEDDRRYKFINSKWMPVGLADPEIVNAHKTHADSPNAGAHWMKNEISFAKLKITNNKETKETKQVLLHSMHKYKPWIVITEESGQDGDIEHEPLHFTFDVTSFIAVTAYQNENITQLKIHNNPFAKAFRDTDVTAIIEGACMLTGSATAAIKALYGNEPDTSFRSPMMSNNMPRPIGCRIPEYHIRRIDEHTRCYGDQRGKMSQEQMHQIHRLQVLRNRNNSIYTHPGYYTGHRKIALLRQSPYDQVYASGMRRSVHVAGNEPGLYPAHFTYNRVKRFNQEIDEWFDLSQSSSKSAGGSASVNIGPQREEDIQRQNGGDIEENTDEAFPGSLQAIDNTSCVKNEAIEPTDSECGSSDEDLMPYCVKQPMLRVPAFHAGAIPAGNLSLSFR